jgi:hypothetical protein
LYLLLGAAVYVLAVSFVGYTVEARGRATGLVAFGAFVVAFLGGGPTGFILFGPALAILIWISLRRNSFA